MRVLSIMNIKGGVGKTATAVNMAYNIAYLYNKKTLLIDLDPQGHSSFFYNVRDTSKKCVADLFECKTADDVMNLCRVPSFSCADNSPNNLLIIPADMRLVSKNREMLISTTRSPLSLNRIFKMLENEFDVIILDHAPSFDMATINGLCACDDVIIPVTPDDFATDGLDILNEHIQEFQDNWMARLQIMGCVFTRWSRNKAAANAVVKMSQTGLPMMQSVIRATCKVPETENKHLPLTIYSPKSTATADYIALTAEYMSKVNL